MKQKYTIGLDFGTNSARAMIVGCMDGWESPAVVFDYPSGNQGVILDAANPHLARQNPADYTIALEHIIKGALAASPHIPVDDIVGIGVDTTGSTPLPIDAKNQALGCTSRWAADPAAYAWLWKDHTSADEAAEITLQASKHRPHYIAKCGNTYSSEWFWSKILRCRRSSPEVFDAAHSWVELADWIPSILAGITDTRQIVRGVCAAGHKGLYCDEWGGLPDKEFLFMLDPGLAALRQRLFEKAFSADTPAGALSPDWAHRTGLRAGIPIAIGELDAHYGAIGSGVCEGTLVKIIGTSTCDCTVSPRERPLGDIPGICGIVDGSILPGHYGLEAGQSAVGDIFNWFVEKVCLGDVKLHDSLTREARDLRPGETGLLALDWNNGNRNVLVDPKLTGLILGQTLHTSRAEIYRALIESTAFGARAIIERLREFGVTIDRIVCCGGIAEKNPLLMQIYADVTGCAMEVASSGQACALGSAVAAAVAAGKAAGGHVDFSSAQRAMVAIPRTRYPPRADAQGICDRLYKLYRQLHDAFGVPQTVGPMANVMKELIEIRTSITN